MTDRTDHGECCALPSLRVTILSVSIARTLLFGTVFFSWLGGSVLWISIWLFGFFLLRFWMIYSWATLILLGFGGFFLAVWTATARELIKDA